MPVAIVLLTSAYMYQALSLFDKVTSNSQLYIHRLFDSGWLCFIAPSIIYHSVTFWQCSNLLDGSSSPECTRNDNHAVLCDSHPEAGGRLRLLDMR